MTKSFANHLNLKSCRSIHTLNAQYCSQLFTTSIFPCIDLSFLNISNRKHEQIPQDLRPKKKCPKNHPSTLEISYFMLDCPILLHCIPNCRLVLIEGVYYRSPLKIRFKVREFSTQIRPLFTWLHGCHHLDSHQHTFERWTASLWINPIFKLFSHWKSNNKRHIYILLIFVDIYLKYPGCKYSKTA